MPERIPQSVTLRVPLKVFLSDGVTEATGKTVAIVISKNGGAFGNPSAGATNATEIASGWYYVDLSTTDTGTTGPLVVRGTAAACDNSESVYNVVNANNGGLAALPNAAAEAAGGLYTRGVGAGQINQAANGQADLNVVTWRGTQPNTLISGRVDANMQALADGILTAAKFAAGAFDAVWTVASRLLTAGTNIVLAKGVGVTGFNDLSSAQVQAAADAALVAYDAATGADVPTDIQNADALLTRDLTAVAAPAARSTFNALRKLMNRVGLAAGTLTIYQEDDATPAYTQTVTQDAAQTPIKSLDTN